MFRHLLKTGLSVTSQLNLNHGNQLVVLSRHFSHGLTANWLQASSIAPTWINPRPQVLLRPMIEVQPQTTLTRSFHAANSKVKYLDFRHRFRTNHLNLHLIIIRRQKMKKHQKRKWRKKFKCLLAKQRLKREIAKEKSFRVELLSVIRDAENFDPKEYALKKIAELHNKPRELTKEERLEKLKQLIREHRHQVTYIKPEHRRADL